MSRLHASFSFGLFGLLGLVACGGGSSTPDAAKPIDSKIIDSTVVVDGAIDAGIAHGDAKPATGTPHRYVANKETVPTSTSTAIALGLDLDGDGVVDNQFGKVLASFTSQGINTQPGIDTGISHGTTIILGELVTTDFTAATDAGFMTFAGANPQPPACTSSADTVCGHHLTGSASFDIATGALIDPPLVGNIVAGTLLTPVGDSAMPLPLAFGGTAFAVNMIGARTKVTAASATGLTAILAGAIPMSEITGKIYPAIQAGFEASVMADCTALTSPPSCGCPSNSQGATALSLFDTNHDCAISLTEISANGLITSLFAPDLSVDGMPALSVGVEITAVAATFTGP